MITSLLGFLSLPSIVSSLLKIIASLLEAVTPVIAAALEAFVQALKWLWAGLVDVLDDFRTIFFVVVVALGTYLYGNINPIVAKIPFVGQNQCEKHIRLLKKQYDQCKIQIQRSSKR